MLTTDEMLTVVDAAKAEIERLRTALSAERERFAKVVAAAAKAHAAIRDLIENSHGVIGLHLNGDNAPWEELLAGGRFESWLMAVDELGALLGHFDIAALAALDEREAASV
jgi:hypothetical protein